MAIALSTCEQFTTEDLDAFPDNGRRYELFEGQIIVSPGPVWRHQYVGGALFVLLWQACPSDLRVVQAPFDVRPDEFNSVQPDLLVARYDALAPGNVDGASLKSAPLLAVEVLSPSSRLTDSTLKKAFYARLGVPSYWIVDPDPERPSLAVFELVEGAYRDLAAVAGKESFEATEPFPVTIVPADLVRGLFP